MTERPAAPRARRAASPERVEGAQVVAVQRGGAFVLDGRAATEAELVARLHQGVSEHPERATVISAEADVRYAAVVHAIELAATAGARRIVAVSPDLPPFTTQSAPGDGAPVAPIYVAYNGDTRMRMNGVTVSNADVVERLLREREESSRLLVTLEAPADARFGRVGALCDVLRRAGAESIRLVTAFAEEPPSGATRRAPPAVLSALPRMTSIDSGEMEGFYPNAGRDAGITNARVPLMLTIEADGRVSEAVPLDDPGYGFARAAVRCVMSGTIAFQPARDAAGAPVRAQLRYTIHFELAGDAPPH